MMAHVESRLFTDWVAAKEHRDRVRLAYEASRALVKEAEAECAVAFMAKCREKGIRISMQEAKVHVVARARKKPPLKNYRINMMSAQEKYRAAQRAYETAAHREWRESHGI